MVLIIYTNLIKVLIDHFDFKLSIVQCWQQTTVNSDTHCSQRQENKNGAELSVFESKTQR